MRALFLLLTWTCFFLGCGTSLSLYQEQEKGFITVRGIASNAKVGAVLIDAGNLVFYIEGLDKWEKSLLNQQVEVSGTLVIVTSPTRYPDEEQYQEIQKQLIIKNSKVSLIKN
jgi:hypothetical protein